MRHLPPVLIVLALVTGIALAGPVAAQDPGPPEIDWPVLVTENLPTTTVMVPNAPPEPSLKLDRNGSWELRTDHWYGWEQCQYIDTVNPFDGEHDLRQKCTQGNVWLYQVIDTSGCAPGSPVWVRTARWIVSNKPEELGGVDVNEVSAFSVPNWTSLALISQHTDLDRSDDWIDNWYRVDGLVDVAEGSFNLVIAASFLFQGIAYHTSFFRDGTEVHCLPLGWQDPPHRTFMPMMMNGVGQ